MVRVLSIVKLGKLEGKIRVWHVLLVISVTEVVF